MNLSKLFAVVSFILEILSSVEALMQAINTVSVPKNLLLGEILVEYFRFHGVRTLSIVTCTQKNAKNIELIRLMKHLVKKDFYVRVFNGNDYMSSAEESSVDMPNYILPKKTFRTDNETRRPLKFQMLPLTHKSGVVFLEFQTDCALNVLRWSAASEHNFFIANRFWLLITDESDDFSVLKDDDIFLPPDSEVRILTMSLEKGVFNLSDIYKISPQGELKVRTVGIDLKSQEDLLNALLRFGPALTYRNNLDGVTFATALVIAFPDMFRGIDDLSVRHIDTISKVNHPITLELSHTLNMRFDTHQMDNYGWRQPNGSFDGLMGMFQRYELDFARMAIFMRLDRIELVDFVGETYRIRAGIIFRQPSLSSVANIFAMPFDRYVWISILVLMVFTTVIFSLELTYSPHHHDMDFWDCVTFVWGAMCQQGFYITILNHSGRILTFSTFVATLFLFTSFSANIVALLQSPSEAISSLSDLGSSPLEIGVQDTQYNKIFFSESTNPVTNLLYHKKIAPKGDRIFMRPAFGIHKIRTGLFAYQVELQAGYQIISETFSEPEKCGLMELEPFQLPMLAIPTRKNFPYKQLFRRHLRWQREIGLLNREELKWIQQKPKCEGGGSGFVPIGLTECRYAIGMYVSGMLLGLIVFWLELLSKYFLRYLKKRKKQLGIKSTKLRR